MSKYKAKKECDDALSTGEIAVFLAKGALL